MERNPDVTEPEPSPATGDRTADNGTGAEPVCSCGAGRHATNPNHCARGHLISGNTGRPKSVTPRLLEELLNEYQPQTTVLRETCEHVARAYAEMKTIPAGSLEWHRILNITQELTATLEESRTQRIEALPSDFANHSEDDLLEQALAIARQLLEARESQRQPLAGAPSAAASVQPAGETEIPNQPTSAPAPDCPYCKRACVGPDHVAYSAFHYFDPVEQKKRDAKATRVMFAQIGKPLPEWYR